MSQMGVWEVGSPRQAWRNALIAADLTAWPRAVDGANETSLSPLVRQTLRGDAGGFQHEMPHFAVLWLEIRLELQIAERLGARRTDRTDHAAGQPLPQLGLATEALSHLDQTARLRSRR